MSTTACFYLDPQPHLGPGAVRFMVNCKHSTTRLHWVPGNDLKLTERQLATVVIQRHEDECGRCNLNRLWQEHADLELKALTDHAWDQIQHQLVAAHLNGRRN